MKFKKVLCLVTSIFMVSNFCIPADAVHRKRRNNKSISPDAVLRLNKILERSRRRGDSKNPPKFCSKEVCQKFSSPTGECKVEKTAVKEPKEKLPELPKEVVPEKTSEKVSDSSQTTIPKKIEEKASGLSQLPSTLMSKSVEAGKASKTAKEEQQKVWGTHPLWGHMALISFDDIDETFPQRIHKDSAYYFVSEKLKTYYHLWRDIELKLMRLKRTLPKEEYSMVYNNWWEGSTRFHISVFASFPHYIKEAYQKAISYPDVVFGRDDCQVKIIEHMQKEWSLESKFFDMEILTSGDLSIWLSVEKEIDRAIKMEEGFWKKLEAYP